MKQEKMVIKMKESASTLYIDYRRTEISAEELERLNGLLENVDLDKAVDYLDVNDKDWAFDSVWKMSPADIDKCQKAPVETKITRSPSEPVTMELDGTLYNLCEGTGVFGEWK